MWDRQANGISRDVQRSLVFGGSCGQFPPRLPVVMPAILDALDPSPDPPLARSLSVEPYQLRVEEGRAPTMPSGFHVLDLEHERRIRGHVGFDLNKRSFDIDGNQLLPGIGRVVLVP